MGYLPMFILLVMINSAYNLFILQAQINSEKNNYKEAIKDDHKFEEVKSIFLKIKNLQKEADALLQYANQLHEGYQKFEPF